jgi:hypothetical protein
MTFKFKHKFGAKRTTASSGRSYASKLEAAYASRLELAKASGSLIFYLEQVPFRLPGGVIYRLDFMEFWENGDIILTEVKGMETPEWKLKHKLFLDTYPLTINVVKKVPK